MKKRRIVTNEEFEAWYDRVQAKKKAEGRWLMNAEERKEWDAIRLGLRANPEVGKLSFVGGFMLGLMLLAGLFLSAYVVGKAIEMLF